MADPGELASMESKPSDDDLSIAGNLRHLPAKMFYGNEMTAASHIREHETNFMNLVGHVRSIIDPTDSVNPSKDGRFRVRFRGAIEQKRGSSFGNISHAGWCLEKAIAITKTEARCVPPHGDEQAKVLILCLYAEQVMEYKSRIRQMIQHGTSRSVFESIDVRTLDSSQGEERDIVFVDFVRTEDVGFCDEAHRLYLSLTRSKGCEILLMNESMTYRRGSKRLAYILDHIPNIVTQECCEYCGDHQHQTENCPGPNTCAICKGAHPRVRCADTFCPNCLQKGHAVSACDQPRHCFQCGSDSHTETACTEKKRIRCYMCGDIGHTRASCNRCPGCYTDNDKHAPSCESAGLACRKCQLFGHRSEDCPNDHAMRCRICNSLGHMAAECSRVKCKDCQQLGHNSRDCPDKTCQICNAKGHNRTWCPERQCFRCKGRGHDKKDCKKARTQYCDTCSTAGHATKDCSVIIEVAKREVLTGQAAKDARDPVGFFHREFKAHNCILSSQQARDTYSNGQEDISANQKDPWGNTITTAQQDPWSNATTTAQQRSWYDTGADWLYE